MIADKNISNVFLYNVFAFNLMIADKNNSNVFLYNVFTFHLMIADKCISINA